MGEDKQTFILELFERCRGTIDRLGRAVVQRGRAASSDGQGAFFVAMLCFGAAAFLFHLSLHPQRISQRYLEDAIGTEQEPLRGETHPVLAGLLLPRPRQQHDSLLCQLGQPSPFLAQLDHSYQAFTSAYFAAVSPAAPDPYNFLELSQQAPTDGVGRAWTDSATGSTLVVPSVVAAAARTTAFSPPAGCPWGDLGCKVHALYRDPILRSLAIEKLPLPARTETNRYGATAWFFISVEGIARTAPAWPDPDLMAADRLYSGSSYYYAALSKAAPGWGAPLSCLGPFRVSTAPYFDFAGRGVVETVCYPVSQPGVGTTVGVLCADLAMPDGLIMAQLEDAATALDLTLVSVDGDQVHACAHWDPPCAASLSRIPGDVAEAYAREVVQDSRRRNSVLGAEGVRLYGDGAYFAIAVTTGPNGAPIVAVGRTHRSHARDIVSLLASSGFLFAGLCVLMMSYRHQLRRREAVLARGLPHGVLRLDDRRRILGANDRAQEIFDLALPGLGIDAVADGDPQAIWFDSLFADERIVLISSDEVHGEFAHQADKLDPPGFLAPGRCRDALDRIEHGYALSFYARTAARWVRVGASPVVLPDLRIGVVVMVNTHLEAAHHPHLELFAAATAGPAQG